MAEDEWGIAGGGGEAEHDPWAPAPEVSTLGDMAKSAGIGLVKSGIGLAGLPGDISYGLNKGINWVGSKLGFGEGEPPNPALTSAHLRQLAEHAIGTGLYEPKTTPGQYMQTIGEFAPNLIGGPGSLIAKAATRVLAPAIGSEAAGELAHNYAPALEPVARIAGAVAGHAVPTGAARAIAREPPNIPSTEELHQAASQGYLNARGYGVEVRRQPLARLADDMLSDLGTDGFRERNIPQTWSAIEELKSPAGRNATIDDIDSVRKVLNKAGAMPGAEREASRRAIAAIDNYLAQLDPRHVAVNPHYAADVGREIEEARGNWAAMKRSEDVDTRLTAADLRAASTGTGGNIDNATRQNIRALLTNKKAIRGFSQAEREQMERVVRGTFTGNVARLLGRLAPTGVVSAGLGLEIGSHLLHGPAGLGVVPIAGAVAKRIGDASTARQARRLDEMVRARSPLGRSLPQPAPAAPFPAQYTGTSGVLGAEGGEQRASGGRVSPKARAEAVLPPHHQLGMRVPLGGSKCGNCRFLATATTCGNQRFVKWNGGATLPAPKDQYCCDLYEIRGRADGGRVSNGHFQEADEALGLNKQEGDLYKRHLGNLWGSGGVDNPDGSRSSLYQAVQEHNGRFYNIPTVWNGKRETEPWTHPQTGQTMDVPNQTALNNVEREGWDKFPSYSTPDEADARYDQMHGFMEQDTKDYLGSQQRASGGRAMADGGDPGDDFAPQQMVMPNPPVIGNRPDVQEAVKAAGRSAMEPFGQLGRVMTGNSQDVPMDLAGAALGLAPIGPPGKGAALKAGAEGALARLPVKAASEDLHEVASANFTHGIPVGNKTVPIETLGGGTTSSPTEAGRVSKLVEQMGGPNGYIRRLITDDAGNVVEGQHRLEALRQLGVKNVPVSVIKDLGRDFDTEAMQGAVKNAGIKHPDQVHGMVRSALEALHGSGGDPAKAIAEYEMPPQFQKPFEAALNAAKSKTGALSGLPPNTTPGILHMHSQIAGMGPEWQNVPVIDHTGKVIHNPINSEHVNGPMLMMDKDGNLSPGILAYHGSPHDFDRFDLSKIGTGEGAQSYGHGLYFAENERVAKGYKEALTRNSGAVQVLTPYRDGILDNSPRIHERYFAARLKENKGDLPAATKQMEGDLARMPGDKTIQEAIDFAKSPDAKFSVLKQNPGRMYQVAIKAPPEHFLDWDKPLSEQHPKVIAGMHKAGWSVPEKVPTADEIANLRSKYGQWGQMQADALESTMARPASEFVPKNFQDSAALREAGIPGIKYLDQGSRLDPAAAKADLDQARTALATVEKQPAGPQRDQRLAQLRDWHDKAEKAHAYAQNPTRNYVVFSDDLIDILKKYGIAGMAALPAMNAYHFQDEGVQKKRAAGGRATRPTKAA